MLCDMHAHSVFSDGTYTPKELVDKAIENGLSAVALTDHNTVEGLPDFISAARGKNIEIVLGSEFSADYNGKELHILGLFIPPSCFDTITETLESINMRKEESNIALVEALARAGYTLDYERIKASTPNGRVNRSQIATALLEKGYVKTQNEAFDTLLSKKTGYYKEPKRFDVGEVIELIRSIGAVCVLAHPFLNLSEEELIELLTTTDGFDGIECYYSSYDRETTDKALRIAERFGLLKSGGSDFHGTAKPDIELGAGRGELRIPYEWYLDLKKRAEKTSGRMP